MITNLFLSLGYTLVSGVINIFPVSSGVPFVMHQSAQLIGGYVNIVDSFVDMHSVFQAVSFIVLLEILLFGFRAFRWITGYIPFVGGKGN